MSEDSTLYNSIVRAGKLMHLVEVKEVKNGKRYLQITENSLSTNGRRVRSVIRVSSRSVDMLKQAFEGAARAASHVFFRVGRSEVNYGLMLGSRPGGVYPAHRELIEVEELIDTPFLGGGR